MPDPELPFLGVHFTRRVDGEVEAGPNAVLAWKRAGYSRTAFSARDAAATLGFPGFWRMAPRYARTGFAEYRRAWSRRAFVAALRRLLPELAPAQVRPAGCGVRAQALDRAGRLVDDFVFAEGERMLHVLNAPSPAATASLAIGAEIAARAAARLARERLKWEARCRRRCCRSTPSPTDPSAATPQRSACSTGRATRSGCRRSPRR